MINCKILKAEFQGIYALKFVGEVRLNACSTLDQMIDTMQQNPEFKTVVIDLTETDVIDSTTLGLLAKIAVAAKERTPIPPTIVTTNADVTRLLMSMGLDQLFLMLEQPASHIDELAEQPIIEASENEVKDKVLTAHRTLMTINESNRAEFTDLVQALEAEDRAAARTAAVTHH